MKIHSLLAALALPWCAVAGPTFNQDIAPLIHENCTKCHRPGEAAPFSLITFDQVRKKARTMGRAMNKGYMPPWHPVDGHVDYAYNRRLSEEEIALFNSWIEDGTPEGEGNAPTAPEFPEGWQLGEPDLILTMKKGFEIPADGPDIYRNFALKLQLPEDKWVRAVEMRPSSPTVVHHSLFFLDATGTAVEQDGKDGKPGFRGMAFRRAGSLGGYVPGSTVQFLPEDLARPLPKGTDLVLSSHFHPSGKPEMERSTVGIYFADKPSVRTLANIQIPAAFGRGAGIDIPAGKSDYRISETFKVPVDVDAISIGGHAHYVCKDMKMTAKFPDGNELVLMHIDDWDLNWQDRYTFAERIRLPAGTELTSTLVYDNSEENPDNPFSPPKRIRWGHESTDEMGSITLMVTPVENADEKVLARAGKMKQIEVLGFAVKDFRNTAVLAVARRAQELDANGDGKVQSSELPERMRVKLIKNFDHNGDDAIDRTELTDLLDVVRSRGIRGLN